MCQELDQEGHYFLITAPVGQVIFSGPQGSYLEVHSCLQEFGQQLLNSLIALKKRTVGTLNFSN